MSKLVVSILIQYISTNVLLILINTAKMACNWAKFFLKCCWFDHNSEWIALQNDVDQLIFLKSMLWIFQCLFSTGRCYLLCNLVKQWLLATCGTIMQKIMAIDRKT